MCELRQTCRCDVWKCDVWKCDVDHRPNSVSGLTKTQYYWTLGLETKMTKDRDLVAFQHLGSRSIFAAESSQATQEKMSRRLHPTTLPTMRNSMEEVCMTTL